MQLHPRCWGLAFSARLELERDGNFAQFLERTDQKVIREQLVRILNSGPFHQSQRRSGSWSTSSMKLLPGEVRG